MDPHQTHPVSGRNKCLLFKPPVWASVTAAQVDSDTQSVASGPKSKPGSPAVDPMRVLQSTFSAVGHVLHAPAQLEAPPLEFPSPSEPSHHLGLLRSDSSPTWNVLFAPKACEIRKPWSLLGSPLFKLLVEI